jgi:ketosteroid isomerase-like protein
MKKRTLTLLALLSLALATPAFAQHKLEYNAYAKDAEMVVTLEQQWADAVVKHDVNALKEILRDDFTEVGPDGKFYTKAEDLASLQSADFKVDSLVLQGLNTRVYQGGAVVTGTAVVKGKSKGVDVSGEYRFLDVLEPRSNKWEVVWRQLAKVQDEKPANGDKKAKD